ICMIGRVALEPSDFDWVVIAIEHHTRAFAQDFGGANSCATRTENVSPQDYTSGAGDIAARDFFDERRDVDAGGTGGDAGRIETKETARSFDQRLLLAVARGNFREANG